MKKKNILIVEDNLQELDRVALEYSKTYNVSKVRGTAGADQLIKEKGKEYYDCLVIDLNMSHEFLPLDDLKKKTSGGSLTGWIWLYNVAKDNLREDVKIVIYSEFVSELEEFMESKEDRDNCDEYQYYIKHVKLSKTVIANGYMALVEETNKLFSK